MLGKVIKYEMCSCGRMLWPFFGLVVAASILVRLLTTVVPLIWPAAAAIIQSLLYSLVALAVMAVILLTFVYLVVRFYQSMVANEAYLSFTLPVGVGAHLGGRLLVGTLFTLLSGVVGILGTLIVVPDAFGILSGASQFPVTVNGVQVMMTLGDIPANLIWSLVGWIAVVGLLGGVSSLLTIYASLAIGTQLTKNRIVGGIVGYLVLNAAESLLSLVAMIPLIFRFGASTEEMAASMMRTGATDTFGVVADIFGFMWELLLWVLLFNLVFMAVHYIITHWLFAKKLNLE